jgi:Family of unknown function (DUF6186)
MSSRDVTIAVYAFFALIGLGLEFRSHGPTSRIPPLATVFSRMMQTRSGRVGIVAGWVWLGLHFFAR